MLVEPSPIRPPSRPARVRLALAVAAAPILLVGIVGTALLARDETVAPIAQASSIPGMSEAPPDGGAQASAAPAVATRTVPDPGFPATILGLPVRSVGETLAAFDAGEIGGMTAIAGYLTLIGPTEDCPDLTSARASSALFCRRETLLADTPRTPYGEEERGDIWAPIGPHLHPVAMPGTYLPAVSPMSIPLERRVAGAVVVVGRFDDPRTDRCERRHLRCDPSLSVEWVPWAAGSYSPPTWAAQPELRRAETALEPRDIRRLRLATIPDSGTMLELLLQPASLERVDPVAWQGLHRPAIGPIWYLRLLDPGLTTAGERTLDVAWLVIDDATGMVIGRGGTGPLD
jgi:hypothetical protein